jgi:hypothetical protein
MPINQKPVHIDAQRHDAETFITARVLAGAYKSGNARMDSTRVVWKALYWGCERETEIA